MTGEPSLSALTQVGAVGVILAALMGVFLWLLRRGVEYYFEEHKALVKNFEEISQVLRDIRNTMYSIQTLADAGRMEAVSQVKDGQRAEADRVINELRFSGRKGNNDNG